MRKDLLTDKCVYLCAELHQQLCRVGAVGGQAAHGGAEVSQTGDGFARLGRSAGPFGVAGASCWTGGEASTACRRKAHQPDQSPDVSQTKRLQAGCKTAAGAAVWHRGEMTNNLNNALHS